MKQLSGTLQSNLNTLSSVKAGGKLPASQGFANFSKDLSGSCSGSWRAVAIFFIVLTIAMASTLAFVIGESIIMPCLAIDLMTSVSASTLVSPSQTEIAKACAVVDSAGMVMVKEEETQGQTTTSHREPGDQQTADRVRPGIFLTSCQYFLMGVHTGSLEVVSTATCIRSTIKHFP